MIKIKLVFLFVPLWNVAAWLPEGAPCTADGYPGTCRHWKNCYTLLIDHRDQTYPPVCSFAGLDTVICCTSCRVVDDVSKIVYNPTSSPQFLYKTDQISWNRCIDYYIQLPYQSKEGKKGNISKTWDPTRSCFQTKIWGVAGVGGRDAYRTEFPHMALLGYGSLDASVQWLCGGTVLSERFILTAGHCTASAFAGPVTYAALGILKRSDPQDLWQMYRIQSIVRHPMYQPPSKYHDIALLKTMQRIIFNKNAMPACLPNLAVDADEETATATGWGAMGPHTQPANTLQVVKLQKFSSWICSTLYGVHRLLVRGFDEETQMCYGDQRQVRDTCTGDSGGPLQIPGQVDTSQATVVGVTSCGLGCGYPGHGAMYTRVRHYVPWIESIIWQ